MRILSIAGFSIVGCAASGTFMSDQIAVLADRGCSRMSEAFAAVVLHVEKASCARIRWDAYDGSGCSQTLNESCCAKAC